MRRTWWWVRFGKDGQGWDAFVHGGRRVKAVRGQKAHEQEVGAITPGERDERDASFAYAVTEAARRDLAVAKVGAGVP